MFNEFGLTKVEGIESGYDLILFTLSTCGFCKKAMSYLNEKGYGYSHLVVDELPIETKSRIKRVFKEKFDERMTFPTLIIDTDSYLIGFVETVWEERLNKSKS